MPVLAVALGIYLPFKLSMAILAGGIVGGLAQQRTADPRLESKRGLLFAAGLVTGEALMGIVLAIPIALSGVWPALKGDPFKLFDTPPWGGWLGVAALVAIAARLYKTATSPSFR